MKIRKIQFSVIRDHYGPGKHGYSVIKISGAISVFLAAQEPERSQVRAIHVGDVLRPKEAETLQLAYSVEVVSGSLS